MRRVVVLALFVLGSTACGAGVRWERSGATAAERQRDETECAARANRDRSVPVQRSVSGSSGRVGQEGIELVTVRDFDSGVFDECMKTRGYERVPPRPPG
jgi:hypothetical protein